MDDRGSIYARVSGPGDPRQASIESQIEATRAALNGYTITNDDIFIERQTGKIYRDREVLNRLRARVREGMYSALGIYCLDRLSRDPTHLAVLFDEFEYHKCKVISATEDIDNSPEGVLIRNIRGYVAQVEREKIADRTSRGTKALLDRGLLVCSGPPGLGYQYDLETHTRVIHPDAAPVVQEIFQLAATGKSIQAICNLLNSKSTPTPREFQGRTRGKTGWCKATVPHNPARQVLLRRTHALEWPAPGRTLTHHCGA